jgi:hypothetical protein
MLFDDNFQMLNETRKMLCENSRCLLSVDLIRKTFLNARTGYQFPEQEWLLAKKQIFTRFLISDKEKLSAEKWNVFLFILILLLLLLLFVVFFKKFLIFL